MCTSTRRSALLVGVLVLALTANPVRAGAADCNIDFTLTDDVTLGALQFDVYYTLANGEFVGHGAGVECANLSTAELVTFDDDDDLRRLAARFVSITGFDGPTELARCRFVATDKPAVGSFAVSVIDASDPTLDPVVAHVSVSQIVCGPCGDPNGDGRITAADALRTLRASVGIGECPIAACDASGDGHIRANDGLMILKVAVGIPIELHCEGDGGTTTTTLPGIHLNVTKSGSGTGTVTSSPAGIDCGSDCEHGYASGTVVTLTAIAASDSRFVAWGGACSGNGSCQVTMSTNRSVTATFEKTAVVCPTNAPLTNLLVDCRNLVYIYAGGGLVEGLRTDGHTVEIAQTDGVDVLAYYGPITAARTFTLTHVSLNGSPYYPILDPGSGGNISSDGTTLNLTIKIEGQTYSFKGAKWVKTEPIGSAETVEHKLLEGLRD